MVLCFHCLTMPMHLSLWHRHKHFPAMIDKIICTCSFVTVMSSNSASARSCNSARLRSLICLLYRLVRGSGRSSMTALAHRMLHTLWQQTGLLVWWSAPLVCSIGRGCCTVGLAQQRSEVGKLGGQNDLSKIFLFLHCWMLLKMMSLACWYSTFLKESSLGVAHLHFLDVTAISSFLPLLCYHMLNNTADTWEQLSPSPAVQLQWAPKTTPSFLTTINGFNWGSLSLWEWLTYTQNKKCQLTWLSTLKIQTSYR